MPACLDHLSEKQMGLFDNPTEADLYNVPFGNRVGQTLQKLLTVKSVPDGLRIQGTFQEIYFMIRKALHLGIATGECWASSKLRI